MENKVVLITGGDKGIGRGIAELLATHYQYVIITYNRNINGAKSLVEQYSNIAYYQCDLADKIAIKQVAQTVLGKYGCVDILVNNAGLENDATLLKISDDQWEQVINVDLNALFYTTQCVAQGMIDRGWGRIINMSSILGYTGVYGGANYAAAKAGVVGFTKSIAKELGGKGITVNAVAPGLIETDLLFRMPEKYRENLKAAVPSHQFGKVEDIANLVEFLVSDKAKYINGQTIHVNGGSYMI